MPPRVRAPALPLASLDASTSVSRTAPFVRTFTTTPCREKMSEGRWRMMQWITTGEGRHFAEPKGGPNYLGPYTDQPFPNNPLFRSQSVLDEQTRELIWEKVMQRGDSLKAVSAEMGVDVRRVAAVVRLKEVEKKMVKDVSIPVEPFLICFYDETMKKIRLVLKTFLWLDTSCYLIAKNSPSLV